MPKEDKILTSIIAQICQYIGWNSGSNEALNILTELLQKFYHEIAKIIQNSLELTDKKSPNINEVLLAFNLMGITFKDLNDYIDNVPSFPFVQDISAMTVFKPNKLFFPQSSNNTLEYVNDYFPNMPKQSTKESTLYFIDSNDNLFLHEKFHDDIEISKDNQIKYANTIFNTENIKHGSCANFKLPTISFDESSEEDEVDEEIETDYKSDKIDDFMQPEFKASATSMFDESISHLPAKRRVGRPRKYNIDEYHLGREEDINPSLGFKRKRGRPSQRRDSLQTKSISTDSKRKYYPIDEVIVPEDNLEDEDLNEGPNSIKKTVAINDINLTSPLPRAATIQNEDIIIKKEIFIKETQLSNLSKAYVSPLPDIKAPKVDNLPPPTLNPLERVKDQIEVSQAFHVIPPSTTPLSHIDSVAIQDPTNLHNLEPEPDHVALKNDESHVIPPLNQLDHKESEEDKKWKKELKKKKKKKKNKDRDRDRDGDREDRKHRDKGSTRTNTTNLDEAVEFERGKVEMEHSVSSNVSQLPPRLGIFAPHIEPIINTDNFKANLDDSTNGIHHAKPSFHTSSTTTLTTSTGEGVIFVAPFLPPIKIKISKDSMKATLISPALPLPLPDESSSSRSYFDESYDTELPFNNGQREGLEGQIYSDTGPGELVENEAEQINIDFTADRNDPTCSNFIPPCCPILTRDDGDTDQNNAATSNLSPTKKNREPIYTPSNSDDDDDDQNDAENFDDHSNEGSQDEIDDPGSNGEYGDNKSSFHINKDNEEFIDNDLLIRSKPIKMPSKDSIKSPVLENTAEYHLSRNTGYGLSNFIEKPQSVPTPGHEYFDDDNNAVEEDETDGRMTSNQSLRSQLMIHEPLSARGGNHGPLNNTDSLDDLDLVNRKKFHRKQHGSIGQGEYEPSKAPKKRNFISETLNQSSIGDGLRAKKFKKLPPLNIAPSRPSNVAVKRKKHTTRIKGDRDVDDDSSSISSHFSNPDDKDYVVKLKSSARDNYLYPQFGFASSNQTPNIDLLPAVIPSRKAAKASADSIKKLKLKIPPPKIKITPLMPSNDAVTQPFNTDIISDVPSSKRRPSKPPKVFTHSVINTTLMSSKTVQKEAGNQNSKIASKLLSGDIDFNSIAASNISKVLPTIHPSSMGSSATHSHKTISVSSSNVERTVITETIGLVNESGEKIWICPACSRPDDGSPMIGCDTCDDWYHWICVNITETPAENDNWYCSRCLAKRIISSYSSNKKKKKKRR